MEEGKRVRQGGRRGESREERGGEKGRRDQFRGNNCINPAKFKKLKNVE